MKTGFFSYATDKERLEKTEAMERSPIKDIEIKHILKNTLTDKINDRDVYMKGIDNSYHYEGYTTFKTSELGGNQNG